MGTRLLLLTVVLGLLVAMPALAELPKTLDEMKTVHEQAGLEPQGAVKCFLDACFVYMNPETRRPACRDHRRHGGRRARSSAPSCSGPSDSRSEAWRRLHSCARTLHRAIVSS